MPLRAPRLVRLLLRDPIVQLYLLSVGSLLALVVLPVLPHAERSNLGEYWLEPLGMVWAVIACWARASRSVERRERTLWLLLGGSFAFWTAALLVYAMVPDRAWTLGWDVAADGLFFGSYIAMLLALESEPQCRPSAARQVQSRLRVAAWTFIILSWAAYALAVPVHVLGANYDSFLPIWLSYLVFDAVVVTRLVGVLRLRQTARWRVVYGSLLAGTLAGAATDILDMAAGWRLLSDRLGEAVVWMYALPALGFVLAARLPATGLAEVTPAQAPDTDDAMNGLLPIGSAVLIAAVSLVGIHVVALGFGAMPPALQPLENVVVTVATLVLAVVSLVAYRTLDRHHSAAQRWQDDATLQSLEVERMESIARLAGGVAHEFNNVLTVIGGFAELAMDGLPPSGPVYEALSGVRIATDRATALTRQLLTIGQRDFVKAQPVRLHEAVQTLVGPLQKMIRPGVTLVTELEPGLEPANVDPGRLEQVLVNLVVNANDAMPDGGTITIAARPHSPPPESTRGASTVPPGAFVELQVRDTGHGIPPDVLPRIFEPFFTTKEPGKGTGLGLATVYGIVRQSGGTVTASSTPGAGTTLSVVLPTVATPDLPHPSEPHAIVSPGTETILVAEDEASVRDLTAAILRRAGYTVLTSANGDEALRVHESHDGRIALLLTDVVMPGMNGRVLAERIVARQAGIRVLFMSGYADDALVRHGVLDGRLSLLLKPFTAHALTSEVRRILDRPPQWPAGDTA